MTSTIDPTREYRFSGKRVVAPAARALGPIFAVAGFAFAIGMARPLLSGGTIRMSVNDGPMQDYGASDPVAWGPAIIGSIFGIIGAAITYFAFRPPVPLDLVAGPLGLTMTDPKGNVKTHDWSSFSGEVQRVQRRGQGTVLIFSLKTVVRTRNGERRETVELAGLSDPLEVERQLLARIR